MKNIRICVSVIGHIKGEFLDNFKRAKLLSEYIELRLDYLDKSILYDVLTEINKKKDDVKLIVTCRHKRHGGEFLGTDLEQFEILQEANKLKVDYIDIDLDIIDRVQITNKCSKIICSYHDFLVTPSITKIEEILDKMRKEKLIDIYKVAFSAKSKEDNLKIYKILLNKKPNEDIIAINMGDIGRETRVVAPLLGSYLTFASMDNIGSAPGQIDVDNMKLIYSFLK